ncbi:MAG TPA: sialidase family protein [Chthoniobacterales bacterium]|nr:sialidase family protein [Chthoniobacterales bacterium]
MKTLAVILILCVQITLAAGAQSLSAGSTGITKPVPKNIDMSQSRGNEAETSVAISHTDRRLITTVSNLESNALFHSWSTDGGHTWQHDVIATGSDSLTSACCDAQLASDDFGNIFLTYLSSSITVQMAISIDGGATFQQLPFLASLPVGLPVYPWKSLAQIGQAVGGDQPSIAAAAGSVWISWTSFDGSIQASGAPVTGLGQVGAFTPVQGIPGANRFGDYGDTAIGPDGQVFVVYQNPTGGEGPATIYGALDPDGLGSQGFGTPKVLETTNVGGFDYIPAQSGRSVDAEAGLAWDRTGGAHNGRLYHIYVSEEPQESSDTDIQSRYSDDNGTTWSTAVRVNDDTGTNSQFNPKIQLDATTGNVAVAWYDARNDLGDNGRGDTNGRPNDDIMIYSSVSKDGGLTFASNQRLSAAASNDNDALSGVDYGDYSGFAFYGSRMFFSAADNSNSTGDNPDGTLSHFDLYVAPLTVR